MTNQGLAVNEAAIDRERIEAIKSTYKKENQFYAIWKRFKKNRMAIVGVCVFLLMIIIAFAAPLILSYEDNVIAQHVLQRYQGPSSSYWFGTDQFGRDIFARVLWGARVSMFVGVGVILISLTFGGFFGAICGFYGGKVDDIIMRFMDILLNIPGTLLAISIVTAFGNSIPNLLLALSVEQIAKMSRIVRSSILTLKGQEFVEAARACGTSDLRIITRHILPNAMAPIIVNCTMTIAGTILSIASLSFIGLGIAPPNPEWGSMLSEAKAYFRDFPHLIMAPGVAIIMAVASLTLIGDGLRDALDPRLKN